MTPADHADLLRYVRRTAEAILTRRAPEPSPDFAATLPCGGAFVTLRRHGALRGCMGRFTTDQTLGEILPDITSAALADPRFTRDPITHAELPDLHIEISILGVLEPVADWTRLVVGRHGVVIAREGRRGCFLPQVAAERNWSLETFLSECCRQKAGLPADAWRDPNQV
ncbi:MAG TPA: AmmeMemoRadiSam system protein A, partial [Phycisphaerae bacterium]|nr:AmmeMemoRadiSam system protein A [Phycisphaerae bacterium]